ncbi:DNA primase [Enterovirga sp.]|uniref:DNA primase n=1 Tax=Enterovirga sp. TaxID=2026350 RepID=UPI0026273B2D|nr:DNA primase [Enterovirga sp.]
MRYPPHLLEEIRARLPVSAVVGRRVQLKKAGREWRGLSPFNAEKTPSFYCNDQKQFYHCFSSSKHGDIFTFLMETEGLSFPEAVERLAGEAGVDLPKASPEMVAQERRHRTLHEVMDLACAFFEAALHRPVGQEARAYLQRRGLGADIQTRFRIGYAPPDRFALRDHLASRDVTAETMAEAGLIVSGDDVAVPFDRFRDRIIFPIEDSRGRVIAFGGRAMSAEVAAKYLNSPDTPLFSKGRGLYNLHRARKAAHEAGSIVVVEGYVDAIALDSVGLGHAVAPLGTALTEDQLALLWRMGDEPILCFDGDRAGQRAAHRAVSTALPHLAPGKSLRFAMLPEGQDPDDLVRSGGRAAMDGVLAAARPLVDMLWEREAEAAPADTPERRAAFAARLREAVMAIRDETVRRFYRDEVETRLRERRRGPPGGGGPADRKPAFRGAGSGWGAPPTTGYLGRPLASVSQGLVARFTGPTGSAPAREALIAAALLAHPAILRAEADGLAALDFADPDARAVSDVLLDCALQDEATDPAVVEGRVERAGHAAALARIRTRVRHGDRWMLSETADPVRLGDALRQAFTLQRRSRTLHSEKRAAELAFSEDPSEANLTWLREVNAELSSLDGTEAERGSST